MKYIEELGVFKAKVTRAFARAPQEKSKPACYIEFERITYGPISAMCLNNPLTKNDLYAISQLVRAIDDKIVKVEQLTGFSQEALIARLDAYKGQVVNIYVKPFELDTGSFKKTLWNVEDVINGRYNPSSVTPSVSAPVPSDIPF